MTYNPAIHHRRSIRLPGYDYSQPGLYFLTICTAGGLCIFGDITNQKMVLNELGEIVALVWQELSRHYPCITPMTFVVMPNHVHGIIHVGAQFIVPHDAVAPSNAVVPHATMPPDNPSDHNVVAPHKAMTSDNPPAPNNPMTPDALKMPKITIGEIVRGFKARCTYAINQRRQTPGVPVWQRNYHDHIMRDEAAYLKITEYIQTNPLRWKEDPHANPS